MKHTLSMVKHDIVDGTQIMETLDNGIKYLIVYGKVSLEYIIIYPTLSTMHICRHY